MQIGNKFLRASLVALDLIRTKDPQVSLGHGSILTRVRQDKALSNLGITLDNYEFDIRESLTLTNESLFNDYCYEIANKSISANPKLVAFGGFIWNEQHIQRIIKILRSKLKFNGKICLGGPQITYAPAGTLETFYPEVDYFIRGYAEDAFAKMLEFIALDRSLFSIAGLHSSGSPDLGIQSKADIEKLPSPFLTSTIDLQRSFIRWETTRGCPFTCAFCQHRDSYSSRQKMCMDRLEKEIEAFCDQNISKVKDIAVLDPTFNAGGTYLKVLEKFAECGYKGKLALQTRIEMVNQNFLDGIKRLQTNGATVVLECGIQTISQQEMKMINRPNNLKKIETTAKKLNEVQIPFEISIIYGLPSQTLESFKKTVDFCKNVLKPFRVDAWPLMLLRGTELELRKEELSLKEEILIPNNILCELTSENVFCGIPHVTSSPTFTKEEWREMAMLALKLNN